jgi:hypothetical protein
VWGRTLPNSLSPNLEHFQREGKLALEIREGVPLYNHYMLIKWSYLSKRKKGRNKGRKGGREERRGEERKKQKIS